MKKFSCILLLIVSCLLASCSLTETSTGKESAKSSGKIIGAVTGVYNVKMTAKKEKDSIKVTITNNTGNRLISNTKKCELYKKSGDDWKEVKVEYSVDDLITYISPFGKNKTENWYVTPDNTDKNFLSKDEYKIRVYINVYDYTELTPLDGKGESGYSHGYDEKDGKEYYIEASVLDNGK